MCDNGSVSKVSVDGADFMTCEQTPFDEGWCSHKFNGPGLKHEVGICLQTGWIVWLNGPHRAGVPDRSMSRDGINCELEPGEKCLADGAHHDRNQWCSACSCIPEERELDQMKHGALARHEAINGLFKNFNILNDRFRSPVEKHCVVFNAVANVTQLSIMMGHGTWDIEHFE